MQSTSSVSSVQPSDLSSLDETSFLLLKALVEKGERYDLALHVIDQGDIPPSCRDDLCQTLLAAVQKDLHSEEYRQQCSGLAYLQKLVDRNVGVEVAMREVVSFPLADLTAYRLALSCLQSLVNKGKYFYISTRFAVAMIDLSAEDIYPHVLALFTALVKQKQAHQASLKSLQKLEQLDLRAATRAQMNMLRAQLRRD